MKKLSFIFAAFAAVLSCSKNTMPVDVNPIVDNSVQIIGTSAIDDDTKVSMGPKSGTSYPVSWNESGERVFLREVIRDADPTKTKTADTASVSFTKIDAHKASFTFNVLAQTAEATYDYAVVYPCHPDNYKADLTHGVRYGGSDAKNRVSYILNHEKSQVPLADAPDPATHIMMATVMDLPAQATSLALDFKYVVGFGRMTVRNFPALAADETVSKITITVPEAQKMTGRKYHYFHANTDGSHSAGDIIPYSSATVKNYVMIDPVNITFNTTGFDVWFTTYPIDLAADDVVSLKVETSKNTYTANITLTKALKFESGKVSEFVYDYKKGQPKAETKTLTFDFNTCPTGWPNGMADYKSLDHTEQTHPYVLDGVTYTFTTATCIGMKETSTRSIAWGYDGTNTTEYFVMQAHRFLGLPAIEGWKLIAVKFPQALKTSSGRKVTITTAVTSQGEQGSAATPGGEAMAVGTNGEVYTFNLSSTVANTRYYFAPSASGSGFASLTLVYEKVEN